VASWRNPAGTTLRAAGEELGWLPGGAGGLARAGLAMSASGQCSRDSGIPCHNPTCVPTQEPQVPVCTSLVPPPSPDVG